MKSLCFSGCSITWGDELVHRLEERYSNLVSQHYECSHNNISDKGLSNDAIVRRTIQHLQHKRYEVVVMQYTVHQRIEYISERAETEKWTPQKLDSQMKRHYYKWIYNDVMGAENLWKNIFLFDSYCKSVGQKYVSIIADHYEPVFGKPFQYYQRVSKEDWSKNSDVRGVRKNGYWRSLLRDYKTCLMHREILGLQDVNPELYSMHNKGGHPSAKAHKLIANKIIELIDAI